MKRLLLDFHEKFEFFIVSILLVLMMFVILVATGEFVLILIMGLRERLAAINTLDFLQTRMHIVFAGFLVILLGIELLETVKMYLTDHVIHVEVVFLVSMIAVGRHIIEIDYMHVEPLTLFGTAALVVSLAAGYYMLKRSGPHPRTDTSDDARQERA